MSHPLEVISQVATTDWNVVSAAVAVFVGTLATTIFGWFKGKAKIAKRGMTDDPTSYNISGATVQDNQSLRDSTIINRELRDQLMLHLHALQSNCRATEDNTRCLDDIHNKLRILIDKLDNRR